MEKIQSLTLSYVADEDRIHLALLMEDGRAARLWLTQRLARILVGVLANHMEQAEGIKLPLVRHAIMAQEQAEAVSAIPPAQAVIVEVTERGHLISDINMTFSSDHIVLAFASDLDIRPGIAFDRTLARQWLGVLHRQFVSADWPQDVWPGWMMENDPGVAAAITRH